MCCDSKIFLIGIFWLLFIFAMCQSWPWDSSFVRNCHLKTWKWKIPVLNSNLVSLCQLLTYHLLYCKYVWKNIFWPTKSFFFILLWNSKIFVKISFELESNLIFQRDIVKISIINFYPHPSLSDPAMVKSPKAFA